MKFIIFTLKTIVFLLMMSATSMITMIAYCFMQDGEALWGTIALIAAIAAFAAAMTIVMWDDVFGKTETENL